MAEKDIERHELPAVNSTVHRKSSEAVYTDSSIQHSTVNQLRASGLFLISDASHSSICCQGNVSQGVININTSTQFSPMVASVHAWNELHSNSEQVFFNPCKGSFTPVHPFTIKCLEQHTQKTNSHAVITVLALCCSGDVMEWETVMSVYFLWPE